MAANSAAHAVKDARRQRYAGVLAGSLVSSAQWRPIFADRSVCHTGGARAAHQEISGKLARAAGVRISKKSQADSACTSIASVPAPSRLGAARQVRTSLNPASSTAASQRASDQVVMRVPTYVGQLRLAACSS